MCSSVRQRKSAVKAIGVSWKGGKAGWGTFDRLHGAMFYSTFQRVSTDVSASRPDGQDFTVEKLKVCEREGGRASRRIRFPSAAFSPCEHHGTRDITSPQEDGHGGEESKRKIHTYFDSLGAYHLCFRNLLLASLINHH